MNQNQIYATVVFTLPETAICTTDYIMPHLAYDMYTRIKSAKNICIIYEIQSSEGN